MTTSHKIIAGDCLAWMQSQSSAVCDVAFTSPPYENARTYSINFSLKGQSWVDWMIPRVIEMCRLTRGLVFINAAGKVSKFRYSPVIEWLVADLTRNHGITCGPAPYVFHRVGIPGSGSKHYHRRDWEPIYAFALPSSLPLTWSDNTALGHPPKWAPGGEMSHRDGNGKRRNQWGHSGSGKRAERRADGTIGTAIRPSHVFRDNLHTKTLPNGEMETQIYTPPVLANPGNVIHCKVGGGQMGSVHSHRNEAPFPESLATFFLCSFCPPDGTILDAFAGSGTVAAVAKKHGRNSISIDVRQEQCDIIQQRLDSIPSLLF